MNSKEDMSGRPQRPGISSLRFPQNFTTLIALLLFRLSARRLLLGQTGNKYVFINRLPTAVHTLLGVVLGKWLIQGRQALTRMALTAAVCLTTGYALSLSGLPPVIKPIATTSFVLRSAGYVILLLAVFAAEWGICFFLFRKNIFFKL